MKQKKEEKIRTAADLASQKNAKTKADGRKFFLLQLKLESMAKNEESDAQKAENFLRKFFQDEKPDEKFYLKDQWERCAQRFKALTGEFRHAAKICESVVEGHQPKICELIEKFSSRRPLRNS